MRLSKGDHGDALGKPANPDLVEFPAMWPSETAGDGNLRHNNIRSGSAQGAGSFKKKISCLRCGFMIDLNKNDHSGGSLDGNGAGGTVAKSANTVTVTRGDTFIEYAGDQAWKKGAGCPMCGSKHSTNIPVQDLMTPEPTAKIGF